MQVLAERYEPETPEKLVTRLVNRLRRHALWDFLLIFLPPLIVAIHCVTYLYRRAWITEAAFVIAALALAALTLAVIMYCYRLALPSVRLAAHLIDERAGATDRFITLSTIEPLSCPASLFGRLRAEATGFLDRIKLKHDFPYKLKRSFYRSLLGSVIFASLFHLLLPVVESRNYPDVPGRLRELAAKMEQRPQMAELARALQRLAAKIENPDTSRQEKQMAVQEMQRKIEQEQNKEEQKDNRDLLGQAASTLKGVEEQSGSGQEQRKNQDKGGGGVQSNLPQEGQGEGKSKAGSGGDSKGEITPQLSKDMQQGKTAQGDPKDQGGEKTQQKAGEGKGDRPDPSQAERDKNQGMSGKTQEDREDKLGKSSKQPEDIPRGAPPAERFSRPGEQGNEGIKGARYVTVQLPEDVAADSQGATSRTKDSKGNRVGPKLPVSNVPLPAHVPDAPTEKQQVPLEYRELIR